VSGSARRPTVATSKGAGSLDQVLQVLQVLRIKGRATADTLATVLDADVGDVIEQCEQAGLVENTRIGYRITDAGRARVDELYATERKRVEGLVVDVYETFLPINDEVKQAVTDWQMRLVDGQFVLNDHNDRDHDNRVISRLHDIDAKAASALETLKSALPRFDSYSRRLQRALAEIRRGDHTMVAAPIKDSYHTVWFELHEDLLLLSGRERTES
jgi:pyruvate, orthophosphate dikinase